MRVCAAAKPGADKKSNVYKFKWIQHLDSNLYYELPVGKQNHSDHPELLELQKTKRVLASMKV